MLEIYRARNVGVVKYRHFENVQPVLLMNELNFISIDIKSDPLSV